MSQLSALGCEPRKGPARKEQACASCAPGEAGRASQSAALQLWLQWVRPCLPLPSRGPTPHTPPALAKGPLLSLSPWGSGRTTGLGPLLSSAVALGDTGLRARLRPPSPEPRGFIRLQHSVLTSCVPKRIRKHMCSWHTHVHADRNTHVHSTCATCVRAMYKQVRIHAYPLLVHLSHTCPHAHMHPVHQGLPLPSHLVVLPWPQAPGHRRWWPLLSSCHPGPRQGPSLLALASALTQPPTPTVLSPHSCQSDWKGCESEPSLLL